MKKFIVPFLMVLLLGFISIQAQTEAEPNNTFATATLILDNTDTQCSFSSNEDVDIFKIVMSTDSIYHIYSDDADLPDDIHIEMFYESDTTFNILHGSPDGRGMGVNFRIAGWVPFEYGPGVYYIKLTHAPIIPGDYTGEYKVRLISQNLAHWAGLHEPDNTFNEAFGQFPLPIDGTRFNGMLFNMDDLPTGKDDIDIFYMAGEQGKRLWVETEPVQGYPHTRDMDSKIYIYDGDGNELLADNDDKSNQEEDFGSNNVFSLAVIDSLPYSGLYYVIMTSYYSAYNHDGQSVHSDEDPSTGGYVAYAWMGETSTELEPNDDVASATAVCEAISGKRAGADNNLIINANFSSDADVDYFAVNLKTTKMYSFNTANSSVGGDILVEVYKKDDPGNNLIDESVVGRYNSNDFRLSGWIPPENGIYIIKLTPSSGSIGGENTGDYQLRMGWSTYRILAEAGEEDNNSQIAGESNMVEYDSSMNYAAIYPAGDEDWFWFEGNAGDIVDVEVFSALDDDGTWGRDLDTKMALVDPDGTVIENDDYRPGEGRHPGNTFSAIKNYVLKGSGTVWIKVEGYYKNNDNDGKNAVGTYRLAVYSSAASPSYLEKEVNDNFGLAMLLPEGKEVVSQFAKGGSPSADDIDVFKINMSTKRMYFINTIDSDLADDIHVELYSDADTTVNLLSSSIDGKYKNNNFRLSGFIPPTDTTYYLKLSITNPGAGKYTIRARSTAIADVAFVHEPDNSNQDADALGDFPLDGVPRLAGLYNENDPDKENDLDVYRISGTAGQMFVAELLPAGGSSWNRDTDTKMTLKNAAGEVIDENDDYRVGDDNLNTYSRIAVTLPATGTYYLNVYSYYSTANGKDPADIDEGHPGVGDYIIVLSGTMSETEPNNTAAEANEIPIADNNLIEASFGTDDLVDWYKVSLEQGKWYYFNTTESNVAEDIVIELYAEGDTGTNLLDDSPMGGFQSDDFRLCGWEPPSTGNYLIKLSVPVGAINDQNIGTYKLRAAGGDVIADMIQLHEPDNTLSQADAQQTLATDSTEYLTAFNVGDHDIFAIEGVEGKKLEVRTVPAHGPRWIRELDTKIRVLSSDSTILGENDDWDDWYELNYYLGDVSNVYSNVTIDSLPYSGTYYVDAFAYYGTYNGKEASLGKNATGSYKILAIASDNVVSVEKTKPEIPTSFGLDQNYPNPFNPTTIIQYRLKEPTNVKLTIYNILGQEVITLVNQEQLAGNYSVQWNATNEYGARVSTGIYFYRLVAGNKFTEVKKMMLLK